MATRAADDARPRATGKIGAVTVLGQNEIEAVGLEAGGRLRLVDLFRPRDADGDALEPRLSALRSLSAEIRSL